MTTNNSEPIMVSVCCITYNHEQYIAQALESFLMQETNFKYEILIGEDHSTDGTREILHDYLERYPGTIRLIEHEKNVGSIRNQLSVHAAAKGKYIALCDGDDFWTDHTKLQKQIDFMEHHPEYVICCHHTEVINDQDELVYRKEQRISMEFNYDDLLLGKREETRICSLVMRNLDVISRISQQPWYFKTYGSDALLKLYALASTGKKIYVMPEVMACYRLHTGGIWSMIDSRVRKRRMIKDFNLMVKHFKYSASIKRDLLKFYLKKYFLFDLRTLRLSSAWNTITSLL